MPRTKPGRTHRDGGTLREPRHCSLAAWPGLWCFLGLFVAPSALAAPTPKGTAIVNVATISADGSTGPLQSMPATVTVRIPTHATLELLEYAPRSPAARPESVVQGAWQPNPLARAAAQPLPLPRLAGSNAPVDLSQPLPLLATSYFHQGDPVSTSIPAPSLPRSAALALDGAAQPAGGFTSYR